MSLDFDPHVTTLGQADDLARRISFGRNVLDFLGALKETRVARVDGGEPLEGGTGITNHVGGFLVVWVFEKVDACGAAKPFTYHVNSYWPGGVRRSRALELALNAFRNFAEHELREGFLFDGTRPFNPHARRDGAAAEF